MRVDLFDFHLPPERIALRPVAPRDAARMLCATGNRVEDSRVADLPQRLRAGDCLVFNDTRVIPAQLEGKRGEARIGATLHKRIDLRRGGRKRGGRVAIDERREGVFGVEDVGSRVEFRVLLGGDTRLRGHDGAGLIRVALEIGNRLRAPGRRPEGR